MIYGHSLAARGKLGPTFQNDQTSIQAQVLTKYLEDIHVFNSNAGSFRDNNLPISWVGGSAPLRRNWGAAEKEIDYCFQGVVRLAYSARSIHATQ